MDDDFKKLISTYNNDPAFSGVDPSLMAGMEYDPVSTPSYDSSYSGVASASVTSKDVDSMKDILAKLSSVSESTVNHITESARINPELAEAITTQRVPGQVRFANKYSIQILDEAKKRFNVIDSHHVAIATDLYLYESAYAIVKLLNKGYAALDPAIREIIVLEERYHSNRTDAARFRQRHKQSTQLKESRNIDIYAAKYQRARDNALEAKDLIQQILDNL